MFVSGTKERRLVARLALDVGTKLVCVLVVDSFTLFRGAFTLIAALQFMSLYVMR